MTRAAGILALGGLTITLLGCAAQPSAVPSVSPAGSPPDASPASPTEEPRALTFALLSAAGYSVEGTVLIEIAGAGYAMTVSVSGLAPGTRHTLNMHAGSCAAENTDPEFLTPLRTNMEADAAGELIYTATYPSAYLVPDGGRILTVHGDAPADERTHIACADLTN